MTTSSHRNSLQAGYKLHWYKINKILGQGGFGITYLARDLNLDRDVAIKEYLPLDMAVREGDHSVHPVSEHHGDQFNWGLERFITEARTLAKFDHPNIVRVYSVFEENNTGYMVMRYEHGQCLVDRIKEQSKIEESEIMKIIMPVLNGLELIHKTGFIHRDIKPDNIYIREDGSPVLIDFGSARQALGDKTKTLTSLLTPGFAPIEQYYSKSDEQGPWTDIYSLAATIYRAITGLGLLDAIDRSKGILESSRDTFVPTVELCEGKYSEQFLKAIDHALQFHRKARPQSIQEWRHEFGIYTDIQDEQSQDEAQFIVTQLSELDLDITGGMEAIPDPVTKQKSKRINPFMIFICLIIMASLAGYLFPGQIINGITSLVFSSHDPGKFVSSKSKQMEPDDNEGFEQPEDNTRKETILISDDELRQQEIEQVISKELIKLRSEENKKLEKERQKLELEKRKLADERLSMQEARRKQEQERLAAENRRLQEQLASIEKEKSLAMLETQRQEGAKQKLAEENKRSRMNNFARFLDRLEFPNVTYIFRGVSNVCDFFSEDNPGACMATLNSCREFAQEDQGLFKFCASEYVDKLMALHALKPDLN